jgi:chitinase
LREAFEAESQEFKRPRLLLTAAVPVGPDNINGGYDVPAVSSYLDFINVMAYDFHGKWENTVGHNAPLFAPSSDSEWRKQLSVDHASNLWVRLGAPREKLIIGMGTYGRSFTLTDPNRFIVNEPASGGGTAGVYTREAGFLAYYEVSALFFSFLSLALPNRAKKRGKLAELKWTIMSSSSSSSSSSCPGLRNAEIGQSHLHLGR